MRAISVQSGSNGNCIYVETASTRLLFDAGVSGVCAQRRLAEHGVDIRDVDAVFISHDHHDHARSAGIMSRKFGLPVYMTKKTHRSADRKLRLGAISDLRHFRSSERFAIGDAVIETIATPHDGVDGVVFVVESGRLRLGILTDLGHVFDGLSDVVAGLDAVFLEANYDPQMLENGSYPYVLKERIRGPRGHISNEQCAELIAGSTTRLQWACLSHLSENNNTPQRASAAVRRLVPPPFPVHVAERYAVSPVLKIVG